MSKESMEKVLYDWRVVLLILVVGLSLWQIHPNLATGEHSIQLGFDLVGGARAVLQPANEIDQNTMDSLINVMQNRLNIYGIKEVIIRPTSDLDGNRFITVEAAGMSESEITELLANQGKLEAQIGNQTIFLGTDVLVEAYKGGLYAAEGGFKWSLPLRIISIEAKQKFAAVTKNLTGFNGYLEQPLVLLIDDKEITSLQISEELKGKIVDTPVVEGFSQTRDDATNKLKRMEAILQTGALPVKLEVTSVNSISPTLGAAFVNQVMQASVLVLVAIVIMLYLYYRNTTITLLITAMSISAASIVLGLASWINWQIDIPSIAGLIIALSVGVDQQVIITDQVLRGENARKGETKSLFRRLKDAGDIIFASFGTTIAAMLPLMFLGLGSLRGFAITAVLGEAVAFFFTRPAYLKILPAALEK